MSRNIRCLLSNDVSPVMVISYQIEGSIPTNMAPAAVQRASGAQPPCGGQLTLRHWVAQRWAEWWASGGPLEATNL